MATGTLISCKDLQGVIFFDPLGDDDITPRTVLVELLRDDARKSGIFHAAHFTPHPLFTFYEALKAAEEEELDGQDDHP